MTYIIELDLFNYPWRNMTSLQTWRPTKTLNAIRKTFSLTRKSHTRTLKWEQTKRISTLRMRFVKDAAPRSTAQSSRAGCGSTTAGLWAGRAGCLCVVPCLTTTIYYTPGPPRHTLSSQASMHRTGTTTRLVCRCPPTRRVSPAPLGRQGCRPRAAAPSRRSHRPSNRPRTSGTHSDQVHTQVHQCIEYAPLQCNPRSISYV